MKASIPHSTLYTPRAEGGQALLELAVFGSMMLMILGVMINYGLNAEFTQQAQMTAMRAAITDVTEPSMTSTNGSQSWTARNATVLVINDHHIPHPANPFGIGQVATVTAAASVARNPRMNEAPDGWANGGSDEISHVELPHTHLYIQGQPFNCAQDPNDPTADQATGCTTAGFRREYFIHGFKQNSDGKWVNNDDSVNQIDRLNLIFGAMGTSVWPLDGTCQEIDDDFGNYTDGHCDVMVVDPCEGELVAYDACAQQGQMMVDSAYCTKQCNKSRWEDSKDDKDLPSCKDICAKTLYLPQPIGLFKQAFYPPWYLAGYYYDSGSGQWVFPSLYDPKTGAGAFAGIRNMGVQPTIEKTTRIGTQLTRDESAEAISTTSVTNWSDETKRAIVFRHMDDDEDPTTGYGDGVDQGKNTSTVCEDPSCAPSTATTETWKTSW